MSFAKVTEVSKRKGAAVQHVGYYMREGNALVDKIQLELDISAQLHSLGNREKSYQAMQSTELSH